MATTIPTASVFNKHRDRIEELIDSNITHFLPGLDPVWSDLIKTSQGVESADRFGRDYKILKVFHGGLSGVLQMAAEQQDWTLYGDNQVTGLGPKLYRQDVSRTFPDPTRGMRPSPYRLGIPMRAMEGSIFFTLGEMNLEALPATIGQIIEPQLRGFARNIAQQMCNYWYLSQNDYYQLCALGSSGNAPTIVQVDGVDELQFQPDNEAVNRFFVGQLVNVYSSDGLNKRYANASSGSSANIVSDNDPTAGDFVVTYVDGLRNYVRIRSTNNGFLTIDDSPTTDSEGFTTGDIVVFANSAGDANTPYVQNSPYFAGIAGINSWLKYSGESAGSMNRVLLGNERDVNNSIDVGIHPEFASFKKDAAGQTLTEELLKKWFRRFHSAHMPYGNYLDCAVTSDGVIDAYEQVRIGRERWDRTSRTRGLGNEGTSDNQLNGVGLTFTVDGKTYPIYISSWVEDGTLYAFRKENNWKMYVPPDISGTRAFDRDEVGSAWRFVGPALQGNDSIAMPIYDTSGTKSLPTEGTQMPGWLRCQIVPDEQVAGMKITNLATDRAYSD